MGNRKFNWVPSVLDKNQEVLQQLEANMSNFYSELNIRKDYNQMISNDNTDIDSLDSVSSGFLNWFKNESFDNILEVGCGTGRIKKILPENISYTGIEISKETIEENIKKWPLSKFYSLGVYDIGDFFHSSFDLIFSFYVIEHLVYPQKALDIMYDKIKPGGCIAIICPDFCASGIFPSQTLGLSNIQSAKNKLKKFKLLDAALGLYDSRIRLRNALKKISLEPGNFFVNTDPACLSLEKDSLIWPDCDAVYVSNKSEIEHWARSRNMKVEYPAGKKNIFNEHIFIVLYK